MGSLAPTLRLLAACVATVVLCVAPPGARPAAADAAYSVAGLVVDTEGYPVERAWVDIRDEAGLSPPGKGRAATTKADGAFAFTLLDGGRYRLRAVAPYCAWTRTALIAAGATDVRVVLTGEKTLNGRVVDVEGKPVSGVKVSVRIPEAAIPPSAETGDDGKFTVGHLTASPGELVAAASGRGVDGRAKHVARKADVLPGETALTVVLGEGLTIEGKVVDEHGRPVRECGVLAIPWERSVNEAVLRDHWPAAWVADDGTFRVEGLEKGTYHLARWFGDTGRTGSDEEPRRKLTGGEETEAGKTGVVLKLVPR
jgi:protocatechuate 3,4-dioxygenase beta subunit